MFKLVGISAILLSMFSCTTQKETKDATFWRKKYEALDAFVKRKGLSREAERAVNNFGENEVKYHFIVFPTHYALNGSEIPNDELQIVVKSLEGAKTQPINIITKQEVEYERLLFIMNELSVNGFKNFNLTAEKNVTPAP